MTNADLLPPPEVPENVAEAMRQIADFTRQDAAKISEAQFVAELLPILTDTSGNVDLTKWLDIAGVANRAIDVVDGGGQFLFRVPPLLASLQTQTKRRPQDAVHEILATAKLKTNVHPMLGQTYLHDRLQGLASSGEIDMAQLRQWNSILRRYGHETLPIGGSEEPVVTASTNDPAKPIFTDEDDEI